MKMFSNPEEFLKLFEIANEPQYEDPIFLVDGKIGFSVKREYPDDLLYKPPTKKNGEKDQVILR